MRIELDWAMMTDRRQAHEYLKEKFSFPDWYGKNLDALYDLLTAVCDPVTVVLRNGQDVEENLGGYGSALLATLREAAEENPCIEIIEA